MTRWIPCSAPCRTLPVFICHWITDKILRSIAEAKSPDSHKNLCFPPLPCNLLLLLHAESKMETRVSMDTRDKPRWRPEYPWIPERNQDGGQSIHGYRRQTKMETQSIHEYRRQTKMETQSIHGYRRPLQYVSTDTPELLLNRVDRSLASSYYNDQWVSLNERMTRHKTVPGANVFEFILCTKH